MVQLKQKQRNQPPAPAKRSTARRVPLTAPPMEKTLLQLRKANSNLKRKLNKALAQLKPPVKPAQRWLGCCPKPISSYCSPIPEFKKGDTGVRNTLAYLFTLEDPKMIRQANKTKKCLMVREKVLKQVRLAGDWAEFGGYCGGASAFFVTKVPAKRKLYIFDSFEGLPEPWLYHKAGDYRKEGKAWSDQRGKKIVLIKGWFKNTVVPFVKTHPEPFAFVHMDADLYSSTYPVLCAIDSLIVPGTIILFDDLVGYAGFEFGELAALVQWARECGRNFHYIASEHCGGRGAIKVVRGPAEARK